MNNWIRVSENIYSHLGDDESRTIFENRLLYSLTGNMKKIQDTICLTNEGFQFYELLQESRGNYVFGAGTWGREIISAWPGYWNGIIDNNNKISGQYIDGIKVGTLQDYGKELVNETNKIFICTRLYYDEIFKQLIDFGVSDSCIVNVGKIIDDMAKRQYFDLPYLTHDEHEVFLDIGSVDAATSENFVNWCQDDYLKIYAFEADEKNFIRCKKRLEALGGNKSSVFPKGCWSEQGKLTFVSRGNGGSSFVLRPQENEESFTVDVTTIDLEMVEDVPTFVKMDIEGSEIEALKGAEKIIRLNSPKLAVSVYHKKDDILLIPDLILSYHSDYTLYFRHYSLAAAETVIYAIPQKEKVKHDF